MTTPIKRPPILSNEVPSGVPKRLLPIAETVKEKIWQGKTLEDSFARTEGIELPILPPDISRDKFNTAIKELREQIGEENVILNDQALVDGWYMEHPNTHDAFHIHHPEDTVSSCVIYPSSTAEVQTIVRWANTYLIPLHPISIGRNLGYGGTAPRVRGSAVLDLGRRMQKILKIDPDNCSCLLEPGVTYYALYEAIQKEGYDLWIDTPDLGGGSVLGNAVDRGVGYTPYGDHFSVHCGMEVVLPTGSVVRTGMGAMPGKPSSPTDTDPLNPCWQSFQYGYGPYTDGIFTQSNFGIVTKMGFWLMPATGHQTFIVAFARDDDFPQIIDAIRPLAAARVLAGVPQLRHCLQELAVLGEPRSEFYTGTGAIPREVIREWMKKNSPLGDTAWALYATVYGPADARESAISATRSAFANIPGHKFYFPSDLPSDHYIHSRVSVCSGVPILEELNWLNWAPNGSHLFFSPILPTTGRDAEKVYQIVIKRVHEAGFDFMPVMCVAPREMHFILCLVYDRSSDSEKQRAVKMFRTLIDECAAEGYGEYRTHILFSDQVAKTYGWNDGALMKMNETIKDALDPNGILAPGRNGIWPKRFRGRGWEILGNDTRLWSAPPSDQARA